MTSVLFHCPFPLPTPIQSKESILFQCLGVIFLSRVYNLARLRALYSAQKSSPGLMAREAVGLTWIDRRCLHTLGGFHWPAALWPGKWMHCPALGGCQSLQKIPPSSSYHPAKCLISDLKQVKWTQVRFKGWQSTFQRGECILPSLGDKSSDHPRQWSVFSPLWKHPHSHSTLITHPGHSFGWLLLEEWWPQNSDPVLPQSSAPPRTDQNGSMQLKKCHSENKAA